MFEDLDLAPWGWRVPQLSFEVFRRPQGGSPGLEERLEGVCLIPGAGEFTLAAEPVLRRESLTRLRAENVNNGEGRPDLDVSLDQLQAQAPALKRVTLVVGWFGDDLRAGSCRVGPGVEQAVKPTTPFDWRAGGVGRSGARLLSRTDGRPNYGGTPADRSVVQAIANLKGRGLEVTLLPFLFMDVPPGNGLPDPYGGQEQAAFPWRGRIVAGPGDVARQVAAFFGTAAPEDFPASGTEVGYAGPDEWSWRRMVLHYATLAKASGGVDGLLIGSELRGLTMSRAADGSFPAVAALRTLVADVRGVLGPATKLSYAADWSEYAGVRNGTEAVFHLDPLWADPAIDYVGIDWYPPLTDWRDGTTHLDAEAGYEGPRDPVYLTAGVAGGEAFDWFYAGSEDRSAQVRTAITDGAGEPWVWRVKDLRGWWENAHHDRPGGVRSATPTAWTPRMKPVRFVELGFPAVDKGANAPNLFLDAKSSESGLPPFSSGARDDLGQRRALEAVLGWFATPGRNPVSPVYGGPMLEAADVWCWDARPFPDFPARTEVWSDGANWSRGHWLNGRTGVGPGAELVDALLARAGLTAAERDGSAVRGSVAGYVVERPMAASDALGPLGEVLDFDLVERGGRVVATPRSGASTAVALRADDLALEGPEDAVTVSRTAVRPPSLFRARFYDAESDYRVGSVALRTGADGGAEDVDLPAIVSPADVEAVLKRAARRFEATRRDAIVRLAAPASLTLEPGDTVALPGSPERFRVLRVERDERPRASLTPAVPFFPEQGEPDWRPGEGPVRGGPVFLAVLDLPPTNGDGDARPWIAVAGEPWRATDVWAGHDAENLTLRARVETPAIVGELIDPLSPADPDRRLRGASVRVRLEGGTVRSRPFPAVLGGENALAIRGVEGEWEVLRFAEAELIGSEIWRLSDLVRGADGSERAVEVATPAGASVVLLDRLRRAVTAPAERGAPLLWRAVPAGAPPGGLSAVQSLETWRGVADRPWAPTRLRLRTAGSDLVLSWARRDPAHDRWDAETVSGDPERYRIEVGAGSVVVRTAETTASTWIYTAAMQAADHSAGTPNPLTLAVATYGAAWGGFGPARPGTFAW